MKEAPPEWIAFLHWNQAQSCNVIPAHNVTLIRHLYQKCGSGKTGSKATMLQCVIIWASFYQPLHLFALRSKTSSELIKGKKLYFLLFFRFFFSQLFALWKFFLTSRAQDFTWMVTFRIFFFCTQEGNDPGFSSGIKP